MRHLIIGCVGVLCIAGVVVSCGPPGEGELTEPTLLAPEVTTVAPAPPLLSSLVVKNVSAPDGTRVRYMLGLIGCGVLELGRAETVVMNGSFEVKFDPGELTRDVDLFYKLENNGGFACDEGKDVVMVRDVGPGIAVVDAAAGSESNVGCWLFSREEHDG